MKPNLPEGARSAYARQLAEEAKTLVPGMERLAEIAAELRADDLYRTLGFDTWERFCVDYLGVSKRTANRWIAGSEPKSITAGQRVAAGQNVPVVESKALNSAKPSEGGETDDDAPRASRTKPPSDDRSAASTEAPAKKSEEGEPQRRLGPDGRGVVGATPTGEGTRQPPSDPSPAGGSALGEVSAPPAVVPRPPTYRALMSRIVGSMHDLDPEDGGPVLTAEEATFVQGWSTRIVKAWQASLGVDTPRRPGRVIKPGDREAKADAIGGKADPATCKHPKQSRQVLGYMVKCGLCDTKVA